MNALPDFMVCISGSEYWALAVATQTPGRTLHPLWDILISDTAEASVGCSVKLTPPDVPDSPPWPLRVHSPAGTNRLSVSSVRLSTVGSRAFEIAGPRLQGLPTGRLSQLRFLCIV